MIIISSGSKPSDKGGSGHPDSEIGGWSLTRKIFRPFGSHFGLKIRGSGPPGPSPGSATDNMCYVTKILPFFSTSQVFYPRLVRWYNFDFFYFFMDFRLLPFFMRRHYDTMRYWAHSISIPKKHERLSYSSVTTPPSSQEKSEKERRGVCTQAFSL